MSARVHTLGDSSKMEVEDFEEEIHGGGNGPNLSGLQGPTDMVTEFQQFKGKLTKKVLSNLYDIGLGYTSATESFNEHNDKLFREVIVDVQGKQRADKKLLFAWIAVGDFDELKKLLDEKEEEMRKFNEGSDKKRTLKDTDIYDHDVSGANIVHVAYLFKKYEIGHYLVQRYPDLASQPYQSNFSEKSEEYIKENASKECKEKLDQLRKLLRYEDEDLNGRMPYSGENILHIVIVRRAYDEVRWLLNFYRDHKHSCPRGLSNLLTANACGKFFDNSGDLNFGGYPLQFAVCANDTKIFDLVFSFASAVDENEVPSGGGGTSAASSSRLVGPNVIFKVDANGNNVLHLCVIHSLKDMYEHVHSAAIAVMSRELRKAYAESLKEEANDGKVKGERKMKPLDPLDAEFEETKGFRLKEKTMTVPPQDKLDEWVSNEARIKVDERLQVALNEEYHSPLTLAASLIKKDDVKNKGDEVKLQKRVDMFDYLLKKMKQEMWSYGPVTHSTLDLMGVEIEYEVKKRYDVRADRINNLKNLDKMQAAIDWLCINDADKAIEIPEVGKLIQTKWERVGYPFFVLSFLVHLFLAVMTTFILIFVNATPTAKPGYATEYIVNVLYTIVAVIYFIMFCQELFNIVIFNTHGFNLRGIARFDKAMRLIKITSFVAFCCAKVVTLNRGDELERYSQGQATVLYHKDDDMAIKVCLTVCILSSWIHLYYFFMGFDSTGPFMLTMFRIISKDVPYFMNFYSIVLFAFACALSMLSNDGNYEVGHGFMMLLQAVWTLIQDTVDLDATRDNINEQEAYPYYLQWLADILLTTYYVIVIILMLNLLIAMISDTYAAYTEYNNAILLIAKYNIMHAMEKVMWDDELRENRSKYTIVQDESIETRSYDVVYETVPKESFYKRIGSMPYFNTSSASVSASASTGGGGASTGGGVDDVLADVGTAVVVDEGVGESTKHAAGDVPHPELLQRQLSKQHSQREQHQSWKRRVKSATAVTQTQRFTTYKFELEITAQKWWDTRQIRADHAAKSTLQSQQTALFIIDPQIDFHPEGVFHRPAGPGYEAKEFHHPEGSLAVPNANEDAQRIAKMIDDFGEHIHEIFVSMDSHHPCHIAHAVAWVDGATHKIHPEPFSVITNEDILKGKWVHIEEVAEKEREEAQKAAAALKQQPVAVAVTAAGGDTGTGAGTVAQKEVWRKAELRVQNSTVGGEEEEEGGGGGGSINRVSMSKWVRSYTSMLERKGKFQLVVWPEHCIIGSRGHSVVPVINDALQRWAERSKRAVTYVMKGQNLRTEMYSALMAEVEDPSDPNTAINDELLNMLKISDRVLVCGQAMSHCVNYTMRDLIDHWGKDLSKLVLLKDGCSPVTTFERAAADFQQHCVKHKVTISTCKSAFNGYGSVSGPAAVSTATSPTKALRNAVNEAVKAEEAKT